MRIARYLNPKWSFWLSVDPLAEKYPAYSPYNYTLLNPVKLVDSDGRSVEEKGCPNPPCNHDYLGMDRDYVNVLIDDVGRINNSRNNDNISEYENNIFKAPYKIDGPDGTKLWSKYGSQNMGEHKGKSWVSVDVEEDLQGLGGNPTGAGVQSMTNKILGLIATILNPIANQVKKEDKTITEENKTIINSNKKSTVKIPRRSIWDARPPLGQNGARFVESIDSIEVSPKDTSKTRQMLDRRYRRQKDSVQNAHSDYGWNR